MCQAWNAASPVRFLRMEHGRMEEPERLEDVASDHVPEMRGWASLPLEKTVHGGSHRDIILDLERRRPRRRISGPAAIRRTRRPAIWSPKTPHGACADSRGRGQAGVAAPQVDDTVDDEPAGADVSGAASPSKRSSHGVTAAVGNADHGRIGVCCCSSAANWARSSPRARGTGRIGHGRLPQPSNLAHVVSFLDHLKPQRGYPGVVIEKSGQAVMGAIIVGLVITKGNAARDMPRSPGSDQTWPWGEEHAWCAASCRALLAPDARPA